MMKNLSKTAAIQLVPFLAESFVQLQKKWSFNKTCRAKISDGDFLRVWMPWRYTSCNRPCHLRSKVWPKMLKKRLKIWCDFHLKTSQKIRQKTCVHFFLRLFCVMIFFCYCSFWRLPNLHFGDSFFVGFFSTRTLWWKYHRQLLQ